MKKVILAAAVAMMLATPAFAQATPSNGGVPTSSSPTTSMYPAPLQNFTSTPAFGSFRRR